MLLLLRVALLPPATIYQISPGKNAIFPPSTCQIYSIMFRIVSGFVLLCKFAHIRLRHLLPVRQTRDLPQASFRFLFTKETIALD